MQKNDYKQHLEKVIIPYWKRLIDNENGGYYSYVGFNLALDKKAEKGVILHSRILWFFSKAATILNDKSLLAYAAHAYDFITKYCVDKENGGLFQSVSFDQKPYATQKYTYNQAFAIYGLCAYYEATKDAAVLEQAMKIYDIIENVAGDTIGYAEAFSASWQPIVNEELSENGLIADKTMNTLLHVLEAYTELYRINKTHDIREKLINLLNIFANRVYNKVENRLDVFFDNDMNSIADLHSYGHDIEATWLLDRACEVVGDESITEKTRAYTDKIASNILNNVVQKSGGTMCLPNEKFNNEVDYTRVWWVQAEAVVGFLSKALQHKDPHYIEAADRIFDYIQQNIVDKREGSEWFWSVDKNENPITQKPITEPWKCPYHNGRMCMEVLLRDEF